MKTLSMTGLIIIVLGLLFPSTRGILEKVQVEGTAGASQSCAAATIANMEACKEMEEKILRSTVRILIESWVVAEDESGYFVDESEGHATVKNGRSLVTHNHFSIPISILQQGGGYGAYSVIHLYDAGGRQVYEGPLTDFELSQQENESLVFAHKEADFLSRLGFESAEFKDAGSFTIEPGTEVAQVDWNGETTRVDWSPVRAVRLLDGTLVLVLDDGAMPGASGGGIFWDGYHIANNWRIEEQIDSAGDIIETVTIAALNRSLAAQ